MRSIAKLALAITIVAGTSTAACAAGMQYPPSAPPPEPYGQPGMSYPGAQPSPDAEVGFFYRELSPYGDWIFTYEYGWTWLPRNVGFDWRPYSYGQWVLSEYGWTWVSYEPFGWATYHFGRWAWHPRFGWIWAPGRTWGPAWVSWQYGQGYVGWAPLPPEVGFEIGIGLRLGGFDLRLGISPLAYTFVEERAFLDRDLRRYALPAARNVTIIRNTTNITNYNFVDNRIYNRGVEIDRVERVVGRRIPRLRVADEPAERTEKVRGDEVRVYRPPAERLESVRVDESKPHRGRVEVKPAPAPPAAPGAGRREVEVAPRVRPEPPVREEKLERQEEKEREKLEAYERSERQRLAKVQKKEVEKEKGKPPAEAANVEKRHAEEKKALEENLQRARQQLEARQEVERRATEQAKASPGKKQEAATKGKGKKKGESGPPPPR